MKQARNALMAIMICLSAGRAIAGEPTAVPFRTMSISFEMPNPNGSSRFVMECTSTKYSFERAIASLRLETAAGKFEAPIEVFREYHNPVGVVVSSFPAPDGFTVYIDFETERSPGTREHAELTFRNGKFSRVKNTRVGD